MLKKLWWIIPLVLLLVALTKSKLAFGISQNRQNQPEQSIVEKIKNWALNALQGEKKVEINKEDIVLDYFIDKLANCESQRNPEVINEFDGGSPSYGYLQFKIDTLWRYNEIYKVLPNLEKQEVPNIIMDKDVQISLAKRIIKDGGWTNWRDCGVKTGLDKY